jgi:metal-responsive CopG/Arc/MetJ family transcriptional regulator
METIQVVLGSQLLRAADRAAQRLRQNRSALIRDALREHLGRLSVREREERDRSGYERVREFREDLAVWEKVAEWPEDERAARCAGVRPGMRRPGSGR